MDMLYYIMVFAFWFLLDLISSCGNCINVYWFTLISMELELFFILANIGFMCIHYIAHMGLSLWCISIHLGVMEYPHTPSRHVMKCKKMTMFSWSSNEFSSRNLALVARYTIQESRFSQNLESKECLHLRLGQLWQVEKGLPTTSHPHLLPPLLQQLGQV